VVFKIQDLPGAHNTDDLHRHYSRPGQIKIQLKPIQTEPEISCCSSQIVCRQPKNQTRHKTKILPNLSKYAPQINGRSVGTMASFHRNCRVTIYNVLNIWSELLYNVVCYLLST